MNNYDAVMDALRKKHYQVSFFIKAEEALDYLNHNIDHCTVGFGDSQTMAQMGLYDALSSHNTVYDPLQGVDNDDFLKIATLSLTTDIFLTSVNALSATGEMVNIDGTGNRIAGSLFGHKKVYFVIGTNKIVPTLEEAIHRARNIAAPQNALKYSLKTPCAVTGGKQCFDCMSPERICNAMVLYLRRMNDVEEVEIILVDDDMGY